MALRYLPDGSTPARFGYGCCCCGGQNQRRVRVRDQTFTTSNLNTTLISLGVSIGYWLASLTFLGDFDSIDASPFALDQLHSAAHVVLLSRAPLTWLVGLATRPQPARGVHQLSTRLLRAEHGACLFPESLIAGVSHFPTQPKPSFQVFP